MIRLAHFLQQGDVKSCSDGGLCYNVPLKAYFGGSLLLIQIYTIIKKQLMNNKYKISAFTVFLHYIHTIGYNDHYVALLHTNCICINIYFSFRSETITALAYTYRKTNCSAGHDFLNT